MDHFEWKQIALQQAETMPPVTRSRSDLALPFCAEKMVKIA
jgi:hypothetical protein